MIEPVPEYTMNKRQMALDDLRPEVVRFALEMEHRLRENDHKVRRGRPMWKSDSPAILMKRLREELVELDSVLENTATTGGFDLEAATIILSAAADVANFAMMTADQAAGDHEIPLAMIEPRREIRVVEIDTRAVIHVVDVTGKSDSSVERAMMGMLRNLRDDCFVVDSAGIDELEPLINLAQMVTALEVKLNLKYDQDMSKIRNALNRVVLRPGLEVALVESGRYIPGCTVTEVVPERGGVLVDVNGDGTPPAGVGYGEVRVWGAK